MLAIVRNTHGFPFTSQPILHTLYCVIPEFAAIAIACIIAAVSFAAQNIFSNSSSM